MGLSTTNMIQGLSSLWREFFANSDELETAFAAAGKEWSQAYTSILEDALGVSLESQPVFRQISNRFFELFLNECLYVPAPYDTFLFKAVIADKGWRIKDVSYITNSVISPTHILGKTVDFSILEARSTEILARKELENNIDTNYEYFEFSRTSFEKLFPIVSQKFNETSWNLTNVFLYPYRYSRIKQFNKILLVNTPPVISGVPAYVSILLDSTNETFIFRLLDNDHFYPAYQSRIEAYKNKGFSYQYLDNLYVPVSTKARGVFQEYFLEIPSVGIWLSDILSDDYTLSRVFGSLLGIREASSNNYKNVLRGLLKYYVSGQSLQNSTTVANVITGLPVFETANESIISIDTVSGTSITTNNKTYEVSFTSPIRSEVLDNAESIDGINKDDAFRWLEIPDDLNLLSRGIIGGDTVIIPEFSYAGSVVKVYNQNRILLDTGVSIPEEATCWGFSVGSKIAYDTSRSAKIKRFGRSEHSLEALEHMLTVVEVVDYQTKKAWFDREVVPKSLLNEESHERRTVLHNKFFVPRIGRVWLRIGDPQLHIGSDNTGEDKVIQIPYYKSDETTNRFRIGEIVYSDSGLGDGVGTLVDHDRPRRFLYVKIKSGLFMCGDVIKGKSSSANASSCLRSIVTLDRSFPRGVYTGFFGERGLLGTTLRPDLTQFEALENASSQSIQPGTTLYSVVSPANTAVVTKVEERDFAFAQLSTASFLMDNLWKYGILQIKYDSSSFSFDRGIDTLRRLIESGSESRVMIMISPFATFAENIDPPSETLELEYHRRFLEMQALFNTQIVINGAPHSWSVGAADYVIGGANPHYTNTNVPTYANNQPCYADLAVDISITV